MSLNIKKPETHALASELARLTGESMAEAVTEAIRERLVREKQKRGQDKLIEDVMAIGRRCAARPVRDARPPDEILYDEQGLPR